ncbi:MAG: ferritin family protein [Sedimentisphaerales bacterium]|nr:ferritin family protein [Sedimentisphaerales bacterium]
MTKESYNLSEVFHMAEAVERNGEKFYRQAAGMAKDKSAKDVMLFLADQELQHERIFAQMRQESCGAGVAQWWDPDGQAAACVKAVADSHVFTLTPDVTGLLAQVQSQKSVLNLALNFEKDTIVFFSALKDIVRDQDVDKVQRLIQEELKHVAMLNTELQKLTSQES